MSPFDDGADREATVGIIMAFGAVLGLLVGFFTTHDMLYAVTAGILFGFFLGLLFAEARVRA